LSNWKPAEMKAKKEELDKKKLLIGFLFTAVPLLLLFIWYTINNPPVFVNKTANVTHFIIQNITMP
jgi:hypothetical protein